MAFILVDFLHSISCRSKHSYYLSCGPSSVRYRKSYCRVFTFSNEIVAPGLGVLSISKKTYRSQLEKHRAKGHTELIYSTRRHNLAS